jgi:hypothetical protein
MSLIALRRNKRLSVGKKRLKESLPAILVEC